METTSKKKRNARVNEKNPAKCGHDDANKSKRPKIRKDVQKLTPIIWIMGFIGKLSGISRNPIKGHMHAVFLSMKWNFHDIIGRICFLQMEFS